MDSMFGAIEIYIWRLYWIIGITIILLIISVSINIYQYKKDRK